MLNVFSKARAKVIKNAKLKTLRVIIAFNVYETNSKGEFKFPAQKRCDYVSSDLHSELEVLDVLAYAKNLLRTDNIELV